MTELSLRLYLLENGAIPDRGLRACCGMGDISIRALLAPFSLICSDFAQYDRDGDGIPEIESLVSLGFEPQSEVIDSDQKLVIVLVESRLLDNIPGSRYSRGDLLERLRTFDHDLRFVQNGLRFVEWTIKQDHHTDFWGDGLFELTKSVEFPKLMQRLQSGPGPLGLISARWL